MCGQMKAIRITFFLFIFCTLMSQARTWTNTKGREIEGDFVRLDGATHVIVKIKEKEHRIALTDLSKKDQKWLEEQSHKKAAPAEVSLLGVPIKAGRNVIPLDTSGYPFEEKNKAHSAKSKIFLFVPEGFDPSRQHNIMVTLGTSSGKGSKQSNSLRHFTEAGLANGWIVMTSDSVKGRPPNYSLEWRITMIDAALDTLNAEWPASIDWHLAAGGSSGGAKAAQAVLSHMGSKKYGERKISGLFLTGCNYATYNIGDRSSQSSKKKSSNVALFYSQGVKDNLAPPSTTKRVLDAIKKEGVRTQKVIDHQGGHSVYKPHVAEAFKWLTTHCAELDSN